MLIDWFTVVAQAINFLILVWLMKHFLYKPILNAIDAREKRIGAELADAATKKAEATKERAEFKEKNDEFEKQRAALLAKATEEAKVERQKLFDEARKATDQMSAKREEALKNDARSLSQAISRRTQQEVFSIARKTLMDLASASLEERMSEVFTRRLREIDGKTKQSLAEALSKAAEPALVRSTFEMPNGSRAAIQNALNETFSANMQINFETAPELVGGVELSVSGQKMGWSIASYLASLERAVGGLLEERTKTEAADEARAKAEVKKKSDAESKVKGEADAMAKADAKAKADADVKITEAKAKAEAKPDAKPETNADVKKDVKPDSPKPESKAP